ncbi:MAG: YjbQ family protein [Deltaproteobacteria bacterium]|nr:MAG: YjbQ family protein [Deltaproteobacteria bacterium]
MWRHRLSVETPGRGFVDLSAEVAHAVAQAGVDEGLCHLFCHHTSAGLVLCENADPDVRRDLETFLGDLVPDGDRRFLHTAEGPDDMPAHIRSILTGASLTLPVRGGRLDLGTWQGIYLYEHRRRPHRRRVTVTVF